MHTEIIKPAGRKDENAAAGKNASDTRLRRLDNADLHVFIVINQNSVVHNKRGGILTRYDRDHSLLKTVFIYAAEPLGKNAYEHIVIIAVEIYRRNADAVFSPFRSRR